MKTLQEMIINMPMYDSFSFRLFDEEAKIPTKVSKEAREQLIALFFTDKVDIRCVECGKDYAFNVEHDISKHNKEHSLFMVHLGAGYNYCGFDSESVVKSIITPPILDEGIIHYVFECTMNDNHYQTADFLYEIDNGFVTIRKIGQKPLYSDLKNNHSNEYKKILEKYDSFNDYRSYEQCASRNLLAGACTYLRRIFEKMISVKIKESDLSKEEIKKAAHIEDRIKLVKDKFDKDIQDDLNNSYSLLSKGIHELDNDEIQTFYKLILEVVNVQLESEKEEKERAEKMKKLRSEIDRIAQKNK